MKLIQIDRYFINPDNVTSVYYLPHATAVNTNDGRSIEVRMNIDEVVALLTEQKGEQK